MMLIEDEVRANGAGTTGAAAPTAEASVAPSGTAHPAPLAVAEGHRWLLGALLGGAGLVHLVMAPSHLGTSTVEGMGFVVAGWLQLALAGATVRAPTRRLLRLAILTNLGLVVTWTLSRTAGLPFGDHAGHAEAVGVVDLTAVGLEAAAVLVALALLRGRPPLPSAAGLTLVAPLAVAALVTGAIASPDALDHAAGAHGEHAAGGGPAHGDAHSDAAPEDDRGLSLLRNGHQHDTGVVALTASEQAELDEQLAMTETLKERFPTLADAEAAGYFRGGPFTPALGTHYIPQSPLGNTDGDVDPEDVDSAILVYDGIAPTSPLAGFMFMIPGTEEPEGFAGPNDHWHFHEKVCIVVTEDGLDTPFGADNPDVTQAMCDRAGGGWIDNTGYMVHVWDVPGYESPDGLFAELNPAITCEDGSYYIVPVEQWAGRDSACRDAAGT